MKKIITNLGVVPTILNPILLLCDNNGTIAQAKEPRSHQKSKYILRRFYLIREIAAREDEVVEKVSSTNNIINLLIKYLVHKIFYRHYITRGLMYKSD